MQIFAYDVNDITQKLLFKEISFQARNFKLTYASNLLLNFKIQKKNTFSKRWVHLYLNVNISNFLVQFLFLLSVKEKYKLKLRHLIADVFCFANKKGGSQSPINSFTKCYCQKIRNLCRNKLGGTFGKKLFVGFSIE